MEGYSSLGDIRELERKAKLYHAQADKNEAATMAYMAMGLVRDIEYLNGCVVRGRGEDIDPARPGRNIFEYIKELETKAGIEIRQKK